MQLSHLSTQYVHVPVQGSVNNAPIDPTTDIVQFAFVANGVGPPITWYVGAWDTGSSGPVYTARILVGPVNGDVVLSIGSYAVYVKISDSPEVPVLPAGNLDII